MAFAESLQYRGVCYILSVDNRCLEVSYTAAVSRQPAPGAATHSEVCLITLSRLWRKKNCLWLFAVEIVKLLTTLSTNRQTFYKLSNISQKLPGIRIQISGLIQVRYWKSTGLLPILWTQYLVGSSYFAKCHKNQPLHVWEMLINLPKSPILQWKSDPESVSKS